MPTDKQARIEELLRKSLLSGKVIDTQFYLFSTRSVSSDRVTNPRVLCANNVLLTNSSKYFFKLLNYTTSLDPSLIEITGDDQRVPSETGIDDYGYGSDSDLDDDDPPSKTRGVGTLSAPPLPKNVESELEDNDESSEGGLDSVASDIFILDPEKDQKPDEAGPSGSEVTVQGSRHGVGLVDQTAVRLPSLKSRRIFVKDTAFQTWYTLLYYLYTGEVTFFPLKSACTQSQRSLSSSFEAPMCSAKSMYRLANKVGLKALREEALSFLHNNITEQNILKELTSGLIPRYPPLLEMELDVLYSYIDSGPIVAGLPALARRIANNEFLHGADIVIGLHQRLLRKHHPMALANIPSKVPCVPCDFQEGVESEWGRLPSTMGMQKKKKVLAATSKIL